MKAAANLNFGHFNIFDVLVVFFFGSRNISTKYDEDWSNNKGKIIMAKVLQHLEKHTSGWTAITRNEFFVDNFQWKSNFWQGQFTLEDYVVKWISQQISEVTQLFQILEFLGFTHTASVFESSKSKKDLAVK